MKIKDIFWVLFISMVPLIELRGAIPVGSILGLPFYMNYALAVMGNLLPVPFILLFINRIIKWMSGSRVKLFNKFANWLLRKAEKNKGKIEKYGFWGVASFIAIPLPITGAWTGSLVAAVIDLKFWKAMLSALIGVMVAGIIVTLVTYGMIGGIAGLFG